MVNRVGVWKRLATPLGLVPAVRVEQLRTKNRHTRLLLEDQAEEVRPVRVS